MERSTEEKGDVRRGENVQRFETCCDGGHSQFMVNVLRCKLWLPYMAATYSCYREAQLTIASVTAAYFTYYSGVCSMEV